MVLDSTWKRVECSDFGRVWVRNMESLKKLMSVFCLVIFLVSLSASAGCSRRQRKKSNNICNCHVKEPDTSWYYKDWMVSSPYVPVFHMIDTQSSLGPYYKQAKTITLKDLIKMHGHPCDGLFTASCAFYVGLKELFPHGPVDRTDLCSITNNSPCYGDVATYLTGGRIRFGTQKIDPSMKNQWIIHRISSNKTIRICLRDGVFPEKLASLEGRIKSGNYEESDILKCQKLQMEFARSLLEKPLHTWFEVEAISSFKWAPDNYEHLGKRGDVKMKNVLKFR